MDVPLKLLLQLHHTSLQKSNQNDDLPQLVADD
jgi:hypothetical protein